MPVQLLTFVSCLGIVFHLAPCIGARWGEPTGAGLLLKQYQIQALNYGSAVGTSSAIISKMANQADPAALTTRTAGPVD